VKLQYVPQREAFNNYAESSVDMQFSEPEFAAMNYAAGYGGRRFMADSRARSAADLQLLKDTQADIRATVPVGRSVGSESKMLSTRVRMPGVVLLHKLVWDGEMLGQPEESVPFTALSTDIEAPSANPDFNSMYLAFGVAATGAYLSPIKTEQNFQRFNADPTDPELTIVDQMHNAQHLHHLMTMLTDSDYATRVIARSA
jgi:hypothetical protein